MQGPFNPAARPAEGRPPETLDAIGELVFTRDEDGRITWANAAFCRTFGGDLSDWVGRWAAFGPQRDGAGVGERRRWDAGIDTIIGPIRVEWEETRLAGGASVWVGRDISRRHAAEEALRGARAAAEAAATAKESVFATLTHEFRTPLNGVLGMADLLRNTELTGEQNSYVDALTESGRHLLGLVNDILDAAALDAGAVTLETASVDPGDLVEKVAELLAPRARAKGIELVASVDAATPARVQIDPSRIRQILLNLAGNAVKFTETGSVVVQVAPSEVDGKPALTLSVRDTGPGIPEADRRRIFEAFAQVDGSAARKEEGAGLGLAIVRRLARAMGGDVNVQSIEGQGSVFWVRVPCKVETPASQERPLKGVRAIVSLTAPLLGGALARSLRGAGADAVVVRASDAKSRLEANPEQLVFADAANADVLEEAARRARGALLLVAPDERADLARRVGAGRAFNGWIVRPWRTAAVLEHAARAWRQEQADVAGGVVVNGPSAQLKPTRVVLLVEDNPVNRLLARTQLARLGCTVVEAECGATAVKFAQEQPFDVIFMDMRLPGIDGLEAARRIRSSGGVNAETPIFALTANAMAADRQAANAAGMNEFLAKPAEDSEIAAALDRWTREPPRARVG